MPVITGGMRGDIVKQDGAWVDHVCGDCGHSVCSCEQLWEQQQEEQRARLAPEVSYDLKGLPPGSIGNFPYANRRPGVRQYLRHGDPRRMSLGYGERDYDESRRVNIKAMRAELEGMKADLLAGRCASTELSRARICMLGLAIAEHERKLPRMPESHHFQESAGAADALKKMPLIKPVRGTLVGSIDIQINPDIPADQAFFIQLPMAPIPYRTAIITGIKPPEPPKLPPPKGFGFSDSWDLLSVQQMLNDIEKP
jgi:hypothetical protein